eukprot:1013829-Rhodomonas_salina.1
MECITDSTAPAARSLSYWHAGTRSTPPARPPVHERQYASGQSSLASTLLGRNGTVLGTIAGSTHATGPRLQAWRHFSAHECIPFPGSSSTQHNHAKAHRIPTVLDTPLHPASPRTTQHSTAQHSTTRPNKAVGHLVGQLLALLRRVPVEKLELEVGGDVEHL